MARVKKTITARIFGPKNPEATRKTLFGKQQRCCTECNGTGKILCDAFPWRVWTEDCFCCGGSGWENIPKLKMAGIKKTIRARLFGPKNPKGTRKTLFGKSQRCCSVCNGTGKSVYKASILEGYVEDCFWCGGSGWENVPKP